MMSHCGMLVGTVVRTVVVVVGDVPRRAIGGVARCVRRRSS